MSIRSLSLYTVLFSVVLGYASSTLLGDNGTHRTYSAKTLGHGKLSVGISGNGAYDENKLYGGSVYRYDLKYDTASHMPFDSIRDSTRIGEIFDLAARAYISLGITNYFDLGVSLPIYSDWLTGAALDENEALKKASSLGIGDLEILGKLQYPPYEHDQTYEMAFMGILTIPTGAKDRGFIPKQLWYIPKDKVSGAHFYTADAVTMALLMLNTVDFKEINRNVNLQWHLNFGIQTTTNELLDNSFLLASSLHWKPSGDVFGLFLEFSGITRMSQFSNGFKLGDDPLFLSPGFTIEAENGVSITLALDKSLTQGSTLSQLRIDDKPGPLPSALCPNCTGDGTYTAYKVRPAAPLGASATLSWSGFLIPQDRDHDGVVDGDDACPTEPEDIDGFEDSDGCPDVDNDEDGVVDVEDRCPMIAQGPGGFEGCPPPDTDKDGFCDPWVSKQKLSDKFLDICKGVDLCPRVAQGFYGKDGCPDPDGDRDGVCDAWVSENGLGVKFQDVCKGVDQCPTLAQGVTGKDGCPDPDTDKDQFCDPWVAEMGMLAKYANVCKSVDKCPQSPETYNNYQDDDGCPDQAPIVIEKIVEKRDTLVQVRKDTVVNTVIQRDTVFIQIEKKATVILHGVNFATGNADLTTDSFSKLDGVANDLKRSPGVVLEIRGHTDNKGSEKKNMQLSQDRADAVCRYLVSQGVSPSQLKATGYGSTVPIAPNKTANGREKNRRIEMYRVQ